MRTMDAPSVTSVQVPVTVRDLRHADLPGCGWSGSALHVRHIGDALDRAAAGEADYVALCPPSGLPVAIGGVDYAPRPDAGTLWQLAVHPALQSCGLGTLLVNALEERARARGRAWAVLGVEEANPRARALYERLGYVAYGSEPDAWDELGPDGAVRRHETMCTLLRKPLS
ncbi:GNAT family N-acetyltransferase [Streptomyces boninensis]|uniref:GNAT family N-acetyltransferase n=1 Tax=Streptomyces boninensis TaxID=2039455 RepID=UPI003B21C2CE